MLRSAEQLTAVQMRGAFCSTEPDTNLSARDAGTEVKHEAVIRATLGDLGVQRRKVEGRQQFVLQADMREDRVFIHLHLEDRIVQVAAIADRQLQQTQASPARQTNDMPRMECRTIGCDVREHYEARIDAGGHRHHRAVLCQHGVQRNQRFAVRARQGAEFAVFCKPRERDSDRQRRKVSSELSIDKHDARHIDARQPGEQCAVVSEGQRLHERCIRHRTQAGIFPCLLTPTGRGAGQARAAESVGGGGTAARITGQAIAHRIIARQEARNAGLHGSRHQAASATMPA